MTREEVEKISLWDDRERLSVVKHIAHRYGTADPTLMLQWIDWIVSKQATTLNLNKPKLLNDWFKE